MTGSIKEKSQKKITKFMKKDGGIITKEDLESYKPVIRKSVSRDIQGIMKFIPCLRQVQAGYI